MYMMATHMMQEMTTREKLAA